MGTLYLYILCFLIFYIFKNKQNALCSFLKIKKWKQPIRATFQCQSTRREHEDMSLHVLRLVIHNGPCYIFR